MLPVMKPPGKIKIAFYLCGLSGAALFTGLLVRQGVSHVTMAFATVRWWLAAVIAYHLVAPIFFDSIAWGLLFPNDNRLPMRKLLLMRWISESINVLVPSATIGGDIVRARLAALDGVPVSIAAASVIVDVTLNLFCLAGYGLLGLLLLVGASGERDFVRPILAGTAIGVAAFTGFYIAQRRGMFHFLARVVVRIASAPAWQSLVQGGEKLDRMVLALYARRLSVAVSCAASIVALVGGAGEIWIGMRALGLETSLVNAVILHTMVATVRSAAFLVPGALGVQEGGYVFVGHLLGIPGEAAFALSLIGRVRELTLGIPGLIAWQWIESRRLWKAGAAREGK